ncbi:uncharacterized protein CDAR_377821 [Caerostris darwini]|uniref:Matrin-type domain-containing protein n=1 Tax=Caerostris darwini TaxID=1538125 RepID=A0AAV4NDE9_9ARAC|nr:uncharacterized protein CDAR_377821 [Caerostris darwini]
MTSYKRIFENLPPPNDNFDYEATEKHHFYNLEYAVALGHINVDHNLIRKSLLLSEDEVIIESQNKIINEIQIIGKNDATFSPVKLKDYETTNRDAHKKKKKKKESRRKYLRYKCESSRKKFKKHKCHKRVHAEKNEYSTDTEEKDEIENSSKVTYSESISLTTESYLKQYPNKPLDVVSYYVKHNRKLKSCSKSKDLWNDVVFPDKKSHSHRYKKLPYSKRKTQKLMYNVSNEEQYYLDTCRITDSENSTLESHVLSYPQKSSNIISDIVKYNKRSKSYLTPNSLRNNILNDELYSCNYEKSSYSTTKVETLIDESLSYSDTFVSIESEGENSTLEAPTEAYQNRSSDVGSVNIKYNKLKSLYLESKNSREEVISNYKGPHSLRSKKITDSTRKVQLIEEERCYQNICIITDRDSENSKLESREIMYPAKSSDNIKNNKRSKSSYLEFKNSKNENEYEKSYSYRLKTPYSTTKVERLIEESQDQLSTCRIIGSDSENITLESYTHSKKSSDNVKHYKRSKSSYSKSQKSKDDHNGNDKKLHLHSSEQSPNPTSKVERLEDNVSNEEQCVLNTCRIADSDSEHFKFISHLESCPKGSSDKHDTSPNLLLSDSENPSDGVILNKEKAYSHGFKSLDHTRKIETLKDVSISEESRSDTHTISENTSNKQPISKTSTNSLKEMLSESEIFRPSFSTNKNRIGEKCRSEDKQENKVNNLASFQNSEDNYVDLDSNLLNTKQRVKLDIQHEHGTINYGCDADEYCNSIMYYCDICKLNVFSESNWNSHISGKKHVKAQKALKIHELAKSSLSPSLFVHQSKDAYQHNKFFIAPPGMKRIELFHATSKIQNLCEEVLNCSIVGMKYVWEVRGKREITYYCSLCESPCAVTSIMPHLTGYKHRLRYLKEYDFATYDRIKVLSRKVIEATMVQRLSRLAKESRKEKIRVFEDIPKSDYRESTINTNDQPGYQSQYGSISGIKGSLSPEKNWDEYVTYDDEWLNKSYSDYHCKICDVHMNNIYMWEAHITGRRHIKNIKNVPKGGVARNNKFVEAPLGTVSHLEEKIKRKCHDEVIIGLKYIRENRGENGDQYNCFLCGGCYTIVDIIPHILNTKHKKKCLEAMNEDGFTNGIEAINLLQVTDYFKEKLIEDECVKMMQKNSHDKPQIYVLKSKFY